MATSLGRLVLDMAANAAGFERDMTRISKSAKKELTKVNRELWKAERDLDRARSKVNRLAGAMGALGAVAIAGVGREFRKFAQEADSLDKVSRVVSLTVEELQELRFAAEQAAGITSNTLDMAMQRFARRVGEAANDTGELNTIVKEMGIQLRNADGSVKSQTELLGVFADEIKNAGSQQEALRIAFKLFDSEGAKMVALMRQGSGAVEDLREQFRRTGATISQETVDATVRFNDSLNILSKNVVGLRNQFFADLIEPLAEYAEFLATTEAGQQAFQDMLEGLADAAKTLGTVIGIAFVGALGKAIITMAAAEVRVTQLAIAKAKATAAAHGYTAGATRAAIATTALGRAVNIALGPVGIAIGVLSTLGITYLSLRDEVEAAAEDFDEFANRVDRAANSTRQFTAAQLEGDLMQIGARVSEINEELKELERSTSEDLTILPDGLTNPVGDIINEGQMERVRELRQEKEKLQAAAETLSDRLESLADSGDENDEANKKQTKSYRDLNDEADRFISQMGGQNKALHSFIDQVQQATAFLQTGAISIGDYAQALRLMHLELNRATAPDEGIFPDFGVLDTALEGLQDMRAEMEEMAALEWNFENIIDSFHPLAGMMRQLGDEIAVIDENLNKGLITNAQAGMAKVGASANAAFAAMMSGVDQTSSEYKKLERAQQITNIALGIAAILQQGMGDPYTAIPRMIAMAAMVASLGVNAGGISGGGSARRQETQGTGTVLGDSSAKSESIANAVEITADATSKLVGINRGMLHSLQQLQQGLTGAAGMVARGAGTFDASGINLGMSGLESAFKTFDPLGYAIDSFVGGLFGFGKTKIKDQGIALIGGLITDMTEGAVAQAFADLKRKSLFGSKSKTVFEDLDEAFNSQLNLIFESMISTVEQAGQALGIPLDEIQARIAAFEVQAQEISLKDLDAEEQQAELEAVFSAIFDDLAASVIPFIDQFQKIGEGMGETLVRVATSVQVAQEAINRLGLNISDTLGPERMAQVSVGLIEAAGGIEQFITDMENFMSKFAPEAHQFAVAQSDITRALNQMGIALPRSREGFWELIQAIDGTTEAGQRQIATLLGLADSADLFYSSLEEVEKEREGLHKRWLQLQGRTDELRRLELETLDESNRVLQKRIWALEDLNALEDLMDDVDMSFLGAVNPAMASLKRLVDSWVDLEEQAIELGASEDQLARIRRAARAEMGRWISDMRLSTLRLAEDFFSTEQAFSQVGSAITSTVENMRDTALRALASIDDWLMSSQLDSNSPLNPVQQLGAAESQFMAAFEAAMSGDFDALANLPDLANQFLSEAGGFYGTSTDQYMQIWEMVQAMMNDAADIEPPPEMQPPNAGQLDTLNQHASNFSQAIADLEQEMSAWQLAGQIDALATAMEMTPSEIAAELGFSDQNMRTILSALGSEIPEGMNLQDHFDDVVGNLDSSSPLLQALNGGHGSITWGIEILEANLWAIGGVLVEIRDELRDMTTMHTGGPVMNDGLHNLQSGEYVIPRNGQLVSAQSGGGDFAEVKAELNRISRHLERGNADRRDGMGMLIGEERTTRRAIERNAKTARAA